MADKAIPPVIARRSETFFRLFALYLRWYVRRSFHAVRMSRSGLPRTIAGRPIILYSNHASWWDPAIYILICDMLFRERAGFGPMDQAALGRYGVFERMGVFGVEQHDPRGATQFLRTSLAVLGQPATMLMVTAEGEFRDVRSRPIRLRPGLAHLVRRVPGAVVLPLAIEYTYWNESRPEILLRFGAPLQSDRAGSVAEWNRRLEAALGDTMNTLAEESLTRNPALFQPLVRGATGVGGIYDVWRWLRAVLQGRRFDPSHEGEGNT